MNKLERNYCYNENKSLKQMIEDNEDIETIDAAINNSLYNACKRGVSIKGLKFICLNIFGNGFDFTKEYRWYIYN